jgi:uncharacterized protein
VGLALARLSPASPLAAPLRMSGRALVHGMPYLLNGLAIVGTAAMIWVGGGIIVHGLEGYGLPSIAEAIHHAAEVASHALPPVAGAVEWMVTATGSGIVGLLVGAALIPVTGFILAPAWKTLRAPRAP